MRAYLSKSSGAAMLQILDELFLVDEAAVVCSLQERSLLDMNLSQESSELVLRQASPIETHLVREADQDRPGRQGFLCKCVSARLRQDGRISGLIQKIQGHGIV